MGGYHSRMNDNDTMTIHPPAASQQPATIPPAVGIANAYRVPGYLPGMRQPALVADVTVNTAVSPQALQAFATALATALPGADQIPLHPSFQPHPVLGAVVRATQAILWQAGFRALDPPVVHGSARKDALLKLVLPAYVGHQETLVALEWAADLMNRAVEGRPVDDAVAALPRVVERVGRYAPDDANIPQFLATARALQIPWRHMYGHVFQFGWGARARRMESTVTGATSALGIAAAKDKRATALLLRAAGIPAPVHETASSADHAARIAARLGYPVVVKPATRDGGRGVGAGLRDEASVRRAYAAAREFSDAVLVEAFVPGNDYRVDVLDGEVYGITHRIPGGVVGDGTSSVAQLLTQLNANPRRGDPGTNAELKRIDLDAEARDLLTQQGLVAESVPQAGQFVRLRGAANVARGGFPVSVIDKAHPDNLALCVRAARVMGLDVAGIDLLMPDIARSWLETGAGICEVNGMPQLARTDFERFFRKLLPNGGRIPVVVVLGYQDEALYSGLAAALAGLGRVGTAWAGDVRVGAEIIAKAPSDAFHAGLALLTDSQVDAAVIGIPAGGPGRSGLPVDLFDVLVLAGPPPGVEQGAGWKRRQALALTLAPLCRKAIIVDSECPHWEPIVAQLDAKLLISTPHGGLADAVRSQWLEPGNDATAPGNDGT